MTNLNLAGLVLALLFIALILSKKDKQLRDYVLAFFIFLLGSFLLIKYVFQNELVQSYPAIIYLDIGYWTLLGPSLYIYTMLSTRGENHFRAKYLYTLLPLVLVAICFYRIILFHPLALAGDGHLLTDLEIVGLFIWLYNSPVFYVLSIIELRKHQKRIKNHYSFSTSVDLKWLYYLSNGFGIFILFILIKGLISILFNWVVPIDNYNISIIVAIIYLFGIGFYGYKQKGIFDDSTLDRIEGKDQKDNQTSLAPVSKTEVSYQKSGLNKEEALLIANNIKSLMQSEQLYLESELDLSMLSKKAGVSTHKLSQVINENLNKNFFDFVNEYRIGKVKDLLSDTANNQYKIISLAYDSGFNSKSTFYTLFRKSEGMTPAEYRRKYQRKAG